MPYTALRTVSETTAKERAMKKLRLIILSLLSILFVFPVVGTALKSLSYNGRFPSMSSYWELFTTDCTYLHFFWNSVFYAAVITFFSILISLPLGFLFAKIRFKGSGALFFIYIVVMMLPFQATLLPNYIRLRDFGLLNTPLALTLPMIFSPFAVFLLRQFIKNIPSDIIDYTLLETSSVFKVLRYAVIPNIRPAIASLAILIFCESWNMVDQALIFSMENTGIYPLSVALSGLPEDVKFSGGTVYMIPIIMLFVIFRPELEHSMESYKF